MRRPRHAFLRETTARLHAAVEHEVDQAAFFGSLSSYGSYLVRLLLFHEQLDGVESVANVVTHPHWQVDRRRALLTADLTALGVDRASVSPRIRRPAIDDATTALGALYVVVGASLGARVLVQQAAALSLPAEGGNAYLKALATSTDWPAFRELLENEPISSEARLGEGANAAFESILEALTATMPGAVSARP